jgi:iron complex outermembrane receptor protein
MGPGITPLAIAMGIALGAPEARAAGPAAASPGDQLEEIVVTGQRREERLQDAALAVSAFTAETLVAANVTRPGDVLRLAPNVTFVQSNHPGEFYVTIRGNTQTRLGESSVALVVDGVQSLDQNNINQELFEIQQIEVLKGPQGALYGRNAIGGAIVITTLEPNFEAWEGRVRAGAGNGGQYSGQVGASGPIGENFAVRGGVSYADRDGYWNNDITGEDVDRFRDVTGFLRGLWRLNDAVTGDFRVSASQMRGGGINWNAIIAPNPIGFPVNAPVLSGDNVTLPYQNNIEGFSENDRLNASMKWDVVLGAVTLISTTSYFDGKDNYGSDSFPYFFDPGLWSVTGAATQNLQRESTIIAQELRLQSAGDQPLRWMVGAYYADFDIENVATTGKDTNDVLLGLGPFPRGTQNQTYGYLHDQNDNEAYAFFGNVTWEIDALELSASLRYDREDRTQRNLAGCNPAAPGEDFVVAAVFCDSALVRNVRTPTFVVRSGLERKAEFSETQPKFSARYRLTDDASVYASWGRGFKTGGFNPFGTRQLLLTFNPNSTVGDIFPKEVADSWEVGFKSQWFDRRVSLNVAYFNTDTENSQLLEFFPAATLQAISTADEVSMKGGEIEVQARVVEGLDLIASYGFLDAQIERFAANPSFVGNDRPSTSPYTWLIAAQYGVDVGGAGWRVVGRADYSRQGETEWDWANTPGAARSAFGLLNARLAVRNDSWEVAAWGRNLTDEVYNSEHIVLLPFLGALFRAAPRQYGIDATYRF